MPVVFGSRSRKIGVVVAMLFAVVAGEVLTAVVVSGDVERQTLLGGHHHRLPTNRLHGVHLWANGPPSAHIRPP